MFETLTLVFLFIIFFWIIKIYNRFVTLKNQVDAAWSDISVQLKRRHDLIPKLVDVVQQYSDYEDNLLTRLTSLRAAGKKLESINPDLVKTGLIEKNITKQLGRLILLVEDYPDLKASEHYIELQKELTRVEDTLQHARRFYNGAVRLLNIRIDSIPDLIIARLFRYQHRLYFDMETKE